MDILLVEDSLVDYRLMVNAMDYLEHDMTVHRVKDGVEALEYLIESYDDVGRESPNLVLLDLNMPRKNGFELLADLRGDSRFKRLPVIVFSTSTDEGDIEKAYDLHCNAYITKPFDLESSIDVLRAIRHFWFNTVQLPPSADA